jgi:hypothetical protein
MMLKTSSKTSWLNVCHILITTVVKFLHENSRQFPLEDHQTTEINNFKNIFDALVIGETDSPSDTNELRYFSNLHS